MNAKRSDFLALALVQRLVVVYVPCIKTLLHHFSFKFIEERQRVKEALIHCIAAHIIVVVDDKSEHQHRPRNNNNLHV